VSLNTISSICSQVGYCVNIVLSRPNLSVVRSNIGYKSSELKSELKSDLHLARWCRRFGQV